LSVFGKSFFQPEYKILKKGFEEQLPKEIIMRVFENRDEILREQISPSQLIEELAKKEGFCAKNKSPLRKEQRPISLLSVIFTNQHMMFQTQKNLP